jgi:hypothetical protein
MMVVMAVMLKINNLFCIALKLEELSFNMASAVFCHVYI